MALVNEERFAAGRRTVFRTVLTVAILYGLACLTPAIRVDDGKPSGDLDFKIGTVPGLMILLFGWEGGNNGIPWSANVFLGLGLLALAGRRFRVACTLGSAATVLGLTTVWVRGYKNLHVGYFLWQASLATLAVRAGVAAWRSRAPRAHEQGAASGAGALARESDIAA